MPCGTSNIIKDIEIIGTFIPDKESSTVDISKERYINAKKGIIEIEKIYLTKKHKFFLNKLHDFASNPFMPTSIQKTLDELFIQVRNNLIVSLKVVIEDFMKEFCGQYFEEKNIPKFDPIGVYNDFNHSRIHHQKILIDLRREIRNYLLIDEPW
jgi:hypothetical protein